ncbi:hypothetical protein, partial [Xanthomonas perforans]|uniref:hypothetical protein n=1 Tax=Xanthomonas perforans TaxID=442694 RepID=UPI001F291BBF
GVSRLGVKKRVETAGIPWVRYTCAQPKSIAWERGSIHVVEGAVRQQIKGGTGGAGAGAG